MRKIITTVSIFVCCLLFVAFNKVSDTQLPSTVQGDTVSSNSTSLSSVVAQSEPTSSTISVPKAESSLQASEPTTSNNDTSHNLSPLPSLSQAEMIDISLQLYEDGYIPWMRFRHGTDHPDAEPYHVYINDSDRSRVALYNSRLELEDALSVGFSKSFITHNLDDLFDTDNWYHIFEHEGHLYYYELGGMGGTFSLYTDGIEIANITKNSWDFVLYGIDVYTDSPSSYRHTFTVVYEDGRYVITTHEAIYDDGSGHYTE